MKNDLLKFNFIHSYDILEIKRFIETLPRSLCVINYINIYNKLSKNDYLNEEASDVIVTGYLMKELQEYVNKVNEIYYVLEHIDYEVISNIKKYNNSLTDKVIEYNIYTSINIIDNYNIDKTVFKSIRKIEINEES